MALEATVNAPGGIYMSSANPAGTFLPNIAAGTIVGAVHVPSPFTEILGGGGISVLGSADWNASPPNGYSDGENFRDSMRGKGQPPMPHGLQDIPVPGGVITENLPGGAKLRPPGIIMRRSRLRARRRACRSLWWAASPFPMEAPCLAAASVTMYFMAAW